MKQNLYADFPTLIAAQLADDSRIAQAKKLLLETVHSHAKKITGVKPADSNLKVSYQHLLDQFNECRGNKLFFPFVGSGIGNGPLVELCDGSIKYDFINGIGPHYLGHSHPSLLEAGVDAALSDTVMQGHLQQNIDSVELCKLLAKAAKMDHCFLTSSGATANENALKIAFQKQHPANRILAFEHCFAGRTWSLSQITDKPSFRDGLPSNVFVDYLPFYDATRPEESTNEAIAVLKQHLSHHPKQYALMFAELVQGENGFYPGSKDFFTRLFSVLKEHGITIIADEVQTFGRTPELFAFHHFGLEEFVDIVTIGKLSQVCATLFTKSLNPRPLLLSQTFTGSTSAIRCGTVILNHLIHGGFYGPKGKIEQLHNYFVSKLKEIEHRHPKLLRGPYGIGAMIAFTPFEGDTKRTLKLVHKLFDDGLMCFTAGAHPARIRFLIPAGIISTHDIDAAVKLLESALCSEEL